MLAIYSAISVQRRHMQRSEAIQRTLNIYAETFVFAAMALAIWSPYETARVRHTIFNFSSRECGHTNHKFDSCRGAIASPDGQCYIYVIFACRRTQSVN